MDQATVQEIKGFFQEIRELYRETDRQFQETRQAMREQSMETDKRFQETDLRLEKKFQETRQAMREQSMETDRKIEETARQMKETDRRLDKRFQETSKKIGELGNRLGEFVEEMVRPCAVRLFQERGVDASMTARDVSFDNGEDGIEIDLLVRNGKDMVVVECKSKLSEDDVNDHLERLSKFKKYFPEYADKKVMGAVAAMVIPRDVARYAYKQGLFVMAQSGDVMTILNDEKFEPKIF